MPAPYTDPAYFALCAEWDTLAKFMTMNRPTKLPIHCDGDDYRAFAKDILAFARQVDRVVLSHGEYLKDNASRSVDVDIFTNQLAGSLEGNALFEISQCEELADEEAAELEGVS